MDSKRTLYAAGFVAASLAYIFVVLAFTGRFNVVEWSVFAAVFLLVFFGFERFVDWAETL